MDDSCGNGRGFAGGARRWWRERFWVPLDLAEASGSLGDLGTFLPLTVALAQFNGLDLGTTFILTGVYNFMSGAMFSIPMPVQPMKSIAAIAVSENPLSVAQIVAAGMCVSAVVLLLGATGLINFFNRLVPDYVVRGMQLGLGLKLAQKGLRSVLYSDAEPFEFRDALGLDGWLLGTAAVVFLLVSTMPKEQGQHNEGREDGREGFGGGRCYHSDEEAGSKGSAPNETVTTCCNRLVMPAALVVVCGGFLAAGLSAPEVIRSLSLGPSVPRLFIPSWQDWKEGFLRGAVPQLPLTTLNSVVAVCHLSGELFPGKGPGPSKVAVSVGLMNLAGGWLGAMPCCHGAGGLAAQVKFGARTGAAVMLLGIFKVAIGLLFGNSLLSLLQHFPSSLLGAMLVFSGAELAMSAQKQDGKLSWFLMLFTAATVMLKGTALGFAVGLGLAATVAVASFPWAAAARRLHSKAFGLAGPTTVSNAEPTGRRGLQGQEWGPEEAEEGQEEERSLIPRDSTVDEAVATDKQANG